MVGKLGQWLQLSIKGASGLLSWHWANKLVYTHSGTEICECLVEFTQTNTTNTLMDSLAISRGTLCYCFRKLYRRTPGRQRAVYHTVHTTHLDKCWTGVVTKVRRRQGGPLAIRRSNEWEKFLTDKLASTWTIFGLTSHLRKVYFAREGGRARPDINNITENSPKY